MMMTAAKSHRLRGLISWILVALSTGHSGTLAAETPSLDEMWRVIQEQQKLIDELRGKLAVTEKKVEETADNVEVTADAIEEVATQRQKQVSGQRTSVGGYGELHYNNLDDDRDDIGGDDSLSRTDFHRFIIYLGHEFNDRIRFFSELEVEHSLVAGDGSSAGEVELEQAWMELDIADRHRMRAGLDILPIGILNVIHEPNTFYGVERNRVESEIIPSTWWEAGVSLYGELAPGWNYDLVAHSGLMVATDGDAPFRPRDGRLKVSEADDQDIAFTGSVRFTGVPGLEIGASGQYQSDITGTDDAFNIDATLFEGHVDWKHASGFGLRAIYARWDLGDDNGADPALVDADTLAGWYLEPAYRLTLPAEYLGELGVFARYSQWDERNRLAAPDFRYEGFEQFMLGFNWWPHPNLAFKFDAQWEDADDPVDQVLDGFNLGIGYQF